MKRKIHLYWQETCARAVQDAVLTLGTHFPLDVVLEGEKKPDPAAFDTARGQYDAEYLLRGLASPDGSETENELFLWLIGEDIGYPGFGYLYGAAVKNTAIVSAARTGFGVDLQKEVCHETGHMFGLDHCKNQCVMNSSSGGRRLAKKPVRFCAGCLPYIFKEDRR